MYLCMCVCVYVCVHTHMFTYTNISYLCPVKGPRSNDIPIATSTPDTQILTSKYHSLLKKSWFIGEITGFRTGAKEYKMSLQDLLTPENRKMLQEWWNYIKKTKEVAWKHSHYHIENNLSNKMIVLDNNPLNKTGIHKSILLITRLKSWWIGTWFQNTFP